MNDQLKDIVKQARLPACHLSHPVALERFAELVRQDEREACAKIALKYEPIERQPYVTYAADEIRARSNHEQD